MLNVIVTLLPYGVISLQAFEACMTLLNSKQDCVSWPELPVLDSQPPVNPHMALYSPRHMLALLTWTGCCDNRSRNLRKRWEKDARRDLALANKRPESSNPVASKQSKAAGERAALASAQVGLAAANKRLAAFRRQESVATGAHLTWIQGQVRAETKKRDRLSRKCAAIERSIYGSAKRSRAR